MLTMSPSICFSYWSLVIHYMNMISEFTIKKLDFVMVAKSALQDIQVISPIVITPFVSKSQKDKNEHDSNVEFFQWSLRKNLETLAFLAELESRYDVKKGLPKFIGDCNAVKIEVQQKTIELTRKLASYKNLQLK